VSRVPSGHGEAPRHQSLVYCAVELTGARRPEIPFRSKEDRQGRVGGQSHRWVVVGSVRLPEPPLCSSGGGPRGRMMVALSVAHCGGSGGSAGRDCTGARFTVARGSIAATSTRQPRTANHSRDAAQAMCLGVGTLGAGPSELERGSEREGTHRRGTLLVPVLP
jgi:hypothetical protein